MKGLTKHNVQILLTLVPDDHPISESLLVRKLTDRNDINSRLGTLLRLNLIEQTMINGERCWKLTKRGIRERERCIDL